MAYQLGTVLPLVSGSRKPRRRGSRSAEVSRLRNERGLPIGQDHHKARLTQCQVEELCALRESGWSQQELADKYGVARRTIRDVLSGRSWHKTAAVVTPWQARQLDEPIYEFHPLVRAWSTPPPP